MGSERHFRASSRPHVACNVRLRLADAEEATEIICHTRDIGEGGLFAVTQMSMVEGSLVDVVVEAPSLWQPVVLPAVVAWRASGGEHGEHAGLGLKFQTLDERQRLALSELLCALDFEA